MRRLRLALAGAALIAGTAGCSSAHRPAHVLRLATANPAGIEHDPALQVFASRAARLSAGRLAIAFDDRWGRDGDAREAALIHDVARGAADLGIVHTRSLALAGARDMDALDAPMLVDRSSLQAALLAGPVARRLLAGARGAGVEGLALLAGPVAHPIGTRGPILGVREITRRHFDVRGAVLVPSRATSGRHLTVAQQSARALGAFVRQQTFHWLTTSYVSGTLELQAAALYEDDLDSLFFDRYGGQCAEPNRTCRGMGPWVTLNVALWPRMSAIVANPAALAQLSPRERVWLREAAAAAARYSRATARDDERVLRELCAAGVRATIAPRSGVIGLRRTWRSLDRRMAAGSLVGTIERLRRQAPPDAPLRIPAGCGRRTLHDGPARGVPSTLPDGVYRVRITGEDLRAAGAEGDRAGIATLTLRGGRWGLRMTEPGEHVESGTYAGTAPRTAWVEDGRGSRDEAYMSVTVQHDGALRISVARADDLPRMRAIYTSHPWRRIGS